MDTVNTNYFEEKFDQLQAANGRNIISDIRKEGFKSFNKTGLPTTRNEEWKYTGPGISNLFKKEYHLVEDETENTISISDINLNRLPGSKNADELIFVNGKFNAGLSTIRSSENELIVLPLEKAAEGTYKEIINAHLNKSSLVIKDGMHALNHSLISGGVLHYVKKEQVLDNLV